MPVMSKGPCCQGGLLWQTFAKCPIFDSQSKFDYKLSIVFGQMGGLRHRILDIWMWEAGFSDLVVYGVLLLIQ